MTALASDPIREVLARLPEAKKSGKAWKAKCPAHDDRVASLSITTGDNGAVLIRCHAGCSIENICDRLGLTVKDLFPPRDNHHKRNGSAKKIVAEYDYLNAAGDLLYQTVRYRPKDFRQRRPDGKSGWLWNLDGVDRVLYRLIELRESGPDEWVYVCEGERDCDRLASLGLIATCNVGGAGKWKPEYNEALRDRRVCIIADKDGPGRKHAQQVAASLAGIAREIRVLELPGDGVKDSSDYLDAGGTAETLVDIAEAASVWTPRAPSDDGEHCALPAETMMETGLVLTSMDTVERKAVEWLWPARLVMGKLNVFFGDPDGGKSTTATYVIAQVSTGGEWPDGSGRAPLGTSFIMTLEDGIADTLGPRLDAARADSSKVIALSMVRFLDSEGKISERSFTLDMVQHLRDALNKYPDAKLVVIDPPASCIPDGVNENSNAGIRGILTPWAKLAEEKNICVLFIMHRPKAGTAKAVHGALGSLAWLAAARAAWMFARDKDDPHRKLFLRAKCNLAAPVPNLAYRIAGPVAHIEWEGEVEISADDVTRNDADPGRPGPDPKKLEAATDWLAAELADFGEHKVTDLRESATAAGLVWRTIQRASAKMGVMVHKGSFSGGYVWRLRKP